MLMSEKLCLTNDGHFHEHKFEDALDKNELHRSLINITRMEGQILIFFKHVKHCLAKSETLLVNSLIRLLDYRNFIPVNPWVFV